MIKPTSVSVSALLSRENLNSSWGCAVPCDTDDTLILLARMHRISFSLHPSHRSLYSIFFHLHASLVVDTHGSKYFAMICIFSQKTTLPYLVLITFTLTGNEAVHQGSHIIPDHSLCLTTQCCVHEIWFLFCGMFIGIQTLHTIFIILVCWCWR